MRAFFILLVLLYPCIIYGQKDTLNSKHMLLYFSPSQVVMGDIPIGIEHNLSKKISHELFIQIKCFNSALPFYKFNRGFGLKYFFKYSIYKNNKINLTTNLGYSYRYFYFDNRLDNSPLGNDINPSLNSKPNEFITSKKMTTHTCIAGLGIEMKISTKIHLGINTFYEYGLLNKYLQINDKGFAAEYNVGLPYILKANTNYNNINIFLKICYEIN